MYDRIRTAAYSSVWAIRLEKLKEINAFIERACSGVVVDAATLEAFAADNRRRMSASSGPGAIGVLPIIGSIVQRGNMLTEASGTASTDALGAQFDSLLANEQVGSILLDIDSPGGTVYGVPELAAKIAAARGTKPILAIANAEAASAAYWLASAADELIVTPSGQVGSIGCYMMHIDQSEFKTTIGVKPSYISYGEHKVDGHPDAPLSDAAREEMQGHVDRYGQMFEAAVAKYRGVTAGKVHAEYGQGRMFGAKEAVAAGLTDRVATYEETLQRLASGKPRVKSRLTAAKMLLEI